MKRVVVACLMAVLVGFFVSRRLSDRARREVVAATASTSVEPGGEGKGTSGKVPPQELRAAVAHLATVSAGGPPKQVDLSRMTELDHLALTRDEEVVSLRKIVHHLLLRPINARFRCLNSGRTGDLELRYSYQIQSEPLRASVSEIQVSVLNGSPLERAEQSCLERASGGTRRMTVAEAAPVLGLRPDVELPSGAFDEHVDVPIRVADLAAP
jgi:hypothetical protein